MSSSAGTGTSSTLASDAFRDNIPSPRLEKEDASSSVNGFGTVIGSPAIVSANLLAPTGINAPSSVSSVPPSAKEDSKADVKALTTEALSEMQRQALKQLFKTLNSEQKAMFNEVRKLNKERVARRGRNAIASGSTDGPVVLLGEDFQDGPLPTPNSSQDLRPAGSVSATSTSAAFAISTSTASAASVSAVPVVSTSSASAISTSTVPVVSTSSASAMSTSTVSVVSTTPASAASTSSTSATSAFAGGSAPIKHRASPDNNFPPSAGAAGEPSHHYVQLHTLDFPDSAPDVSSPSAFPPSSSSVATAPAPTSAPTPTVAALGVSSAAAAAAVPFNQNIIRDIEKKLRAEDLALCKTLNDSQKCKYNLIRSYLTALHSQTLRGLPNSHVDYSHAHSAHLTKQRRDRSIDQSKKIIASSSAGSMVIDNALPSSEMDIVLATYNKYAPPAAAGSVLPEQENSGSNSGSGSGGNPEQKAAYQNMCFGPAPSIRADFYAASPPNVPPRPMQPPRARAHAVGSVVVDDKGGMSSHSASASSAHVVGVAQASQSLFNQAPLGGAGSFPMTKKPGLIAPGSGAHSIDALQADALRNTPGPS